MDDIRRLIRSRSLVFDFETGGMDELRHPLIEGGVLDVRTGRLRRTVFSFGLRQEGRWRPLSQEELLESLDPWARAKFAEGGPWQPFLSERGRMPSDWLRRNLVEAVVQGRWIWAHNARFDLRFLAQNLTESGYQRLAESFPESLLSPWSRAMGRLHVTAGRRTYQILQRARRDPWRVTRHYVRSWEPFIQTLQEAARRRQGLLLDTQYVMQVALAHAQEAGLMKATQDVFTGTSVEAYRVAFQRSFPGPAHTVGPDIRATAALLEDYLDIIQRLRQKQPLTQEQLRALRFHEELQQLLFPENAFLQFMRARQQLLQHQPYEYFNLSGRQAYSWNFRDILYIYQSRQAIYGYRADLEEIHQRVSRMTAEEIEKLLAEKDVRLQQILSQAWEASARPASWRLSRSKGWGLGSNRLIQAIRNYPFLTFAAGVGLTIAGLGFFSGRDDEYNTIEGLQHGWFGEQRRYITDFSSGYRDSEVSQSWLSQAWEWTKNNWASFSIIAGAIGAGILARHLDLPGFRGLHAYASNLSARLAARGENKGFFGGLLYKVAADIVEYPVALGGALGAAAAYEGFYRDEPVKATDVVKAFSLAALDLADDLLYFGAIKIGSRIFSEESSVMERLLQSTGVRAAGHLIRATGAATVGYAIGKAAGMVVRWHQQRRQQQEAGLVQRLHRNRTNHQRMNGY